MNNYESQEHFKLRVPAEIAQGRLELVQFSLGDMERVLGIAMEMLSKPEYSFTPSTEQQPVQVVDELAARRDAKKMATTTAEVNQTRYGVPNAQEAA